jgi:hypothetical protein
MRIDEEFLISLEGKAFGAGLELGTRIGYVNLIAWLGIIAYLTSAL